MDKMFYSQQLFISDAKNISVSDSSQDLTTNIS